MYEKGCSIRGDIQDRKLRSGKLAKTFFRLEGLGFKGLGFRHRVAAAGCGS